MAWFNKAIARLRRIYLPLAQIQTNKLKLDGQGRARREAARRRKSKWKVNLGIRKIPLAAMAAGERVRKEPLGISVSLQYTSSSDASICAL